MPNTKLEKRRGLGFTAVACVLVAWFGITQAGCVRSPEAKEARYLESGKRMMEKKDYARALIQFRNASKAVPNDAEPYYQAGLVNIERREWQAAYTNLKKAVDLNPKHQHAQLKFAELLAMSGRKDQVEQAHKAISDLIKTGPAAPRSSTRWPSPNSSLATSRMRKSIWKRLLPNSRLT